MSISSYLENNVKNKHIQRINAIAYSQGHYDAKVAAISIVDKYERYIKHLEGLAGELQDSLISGVVDLDSIKKECGL